MRNFAHMARICLGKFHEFQLTPDWHYRCLAVYVDETKWRESQDKVIQERLPSLKFLSVDKMLGAPQAISSSSWATSARSWKSSSVQSSLQATIPAVFVAAGTSTHGVPSSPGVASLPTVSRVTRKLLLMMKKMLLLMMTKFPRTGNKPQSKKEDWSIF